MGMASADSVLAMDGDTFFIHYATNADRSSFYDSGIIYAAVRVGRGNHVIPLC
jgi:hypothetical protein